MAKGRSGANFSDTIKLHDCDFLKKVGYVGSLDLTEEHQNGQSICYLAETSTVLS